MSFPNHYLAPGTKENWQAAFANGNVWATNQSRQGVWQKLKTGDVIFFYLLLPVCAVIGWGEILGTSGPEAEPFYPDDPRQATKWPFRIKFKVGQLGGAQVSAAELRDLRITPRGSIQYVSPRKAQKLLERFR